MAESDGAGAVLDQDPIARVQGALGQPGDVRLDLAHERRRTNPEQAAKANPINYVLAAAPPF